MKKIGIMTDSHSGILSEEAQRLGIKVLPMPFYIGEKVYREGVDLSRDEFYDMLRKGVDVSTSQPSPTEVMDMWKEMLKEYEEIVYIPLSSAFLLRLTVETEPRTRIELVSIVCWPSAPVEELLLWGIQPFGRLRTK